MRGSTPYSDLNGVLRIWVDGVQGVLGSSFIGAYLQGSFAIGDFDRHSDVDFAVVTEQEMPEPQVSALQTLHGRIFELECSWAQHLEGSYFPREVLRDLSQSGGLLWYLDHGSRSLIRSNHCNTLVVRWVLREHSVALAGPDPADLIDSIPVDALRAEIAATIRDWGHEILAEPDRYNNRFYQAFIVLSYCRMLHSLHVGRVDSKRAGAEWAKANLDPVWTGLIDRTWTGRPNPAESVRQRADPDDFRATLEFVQFIMVERARRFPGL